jgi:hypothetical protein
MRNPKDEKSPRSKNGKKPAGKPTAGEFRFLNVVFTDDIKKKIEMWSRGEDDVWKYVETLAGQGYRLGVSWDGHNDCAIASLTNRSGDGRYLGACVTVRGPSTWAAVVRLVGLHYAVAGEDWALLEQPATPDDLW